MNVLQEITPPLQIGLIAPSKSQNHGPVLLDSLSIQRVLLAALHSHSNLAFYWISPRIRSDSYKQPTVFLAKPAPGAAQDL